MIGQLFVDRLLKGELPHKIDGENVVIELPDCPPKDRALQ